MRLASLSLCFSFGCCYMRRWSKYKHSNPMKWRDPTRAFHSNEELCALFCSMKTTVSREYRASHFFCLYVQYHLQLRGRRYGVMKPFFSLSLFTLLLFYFISHFSLFFRLLLLFVRKYLSEPVVCFQPTLIPNVFVLSEWWIWKHYAITVWPPCCCWIGGWCGVVVW